ncbi:hypothetical protein BJV78DRAFT_708869 [Lactifluus subvellereus]|nr:hypothetical protein BJV78DRAFT_708869 [Lactifluus subvellereus]
MHSVRMLLIFVSPSRCYAGAFSNSRTPLVEDVRLLYRSSCLRTSVTLNGIRCVLACHRGTVARMTLTFTDPQISLSCHRYCSIRSQNHPSSGSRASALILPTIHSLIPISGASKTHKMDSAPYVTGKSRARKEKRVTIGGLRRSPTMSS